MMYKSNFREFIIYVFIKTFFSGHYTTYCWNEGENTKSALSGWMEYNDSEVQPARIKDVLKSQAYMLLYVDTELANVDKT